MPLDLLPILFIVASKPAPEKSLSGLQQRSASQKRIAAPELCESVLWTEKKEVSRRANETRSTCAQSFIGSCLRRRRRHYWRCCRLDESCRQRVPRLQPASPHIPRCPGLVRPSKA